MTTLSIPPQAAPTPMIRVVSGYPTSKNYHALAATMRERSVVCLIPYNGNPNVRDVAHTRFRVNGEGVEEFTVSARGYGYIDALGVDEFVRICESEDLEYLLTPPETAARIESLESEVAKLRDALASGQPPTAKSL